MSTKQLENPTTELSTFLNSYLSDSGHSEDMVAQRFKVSVETVRRWRMGEFWEHPSLMVVIIRILDQE